LPAYSKIQHRLKRRRGQALGEFVVAVPIFIVMLFFAWYFSDLVQVRLDTQEMARLVAWEPTNRAMSDFNNGDHRSAQRNATQDGARIVRSLYRDMDPTREDNQMPRKLTIDRAIDEVRLDLSAGPAGNDPMIGSSFEQQGVVEGTVTNTAVGIDEFFPHNLLLGSHFRENPFAKMRQTLRFTDRYRLLADSWRLHDGQDVVPGDRDKAFTKQVDRLAWGVAGFGDVVQAWPALGAQLSLLTGYDHDPFETVVASKNYSDGPDSGRHAVDVSGGQDRFDTAPMRVDDADGSGSAYGQTLSGRSNHYLGCRTLKPEAECFR